MSETWYTKPVGGDHGQHLVISEDSGANVAVVYADNGDAELIAAAPALLANCEQLTKLVEDYISGRLVVWPASALPQARAAIAMAKGR